MLSQLLKIKQCRETGLRNRARRLDAELQAGKAAREKGKADQATLRDEWRAASKAEQAVAGTAFRKLKESLHGFYESEQLLREKLRELAGEVEETGRRSHETGERLKANLRGQEKLMVVIEERK